MTNEPLNGSGRRKVVKSDEGRRQRPLEVRNSRRRAVSQLYKISTTRVRFALLKAYAGFERLHYFVRK
jgi:hypothetical protein